MNRIAAFLMLAALLAPSLAAAPHSVTTVILVRHAEKAADGGSDPSLTAAGVERAKELVRVLEGVTIDAIYTTQYKRTRETAAPIAAARGVEATVRTGGATFAAEMARHIQANHAGKTVLVVGHSNTTIDVIRAFGVTDVVPMPESQFDNLYVLTDVEGASPKVVALRYGAVAR